MYRPQSVCSLVIQNLWFPKDIQFPFHRILDHYSLIRICPNLPYIWMGHRSHLDKYHDAYRLLFRPGIQRRMRFLKIIITLSPILTLVGHFRARFYINLLKSTFGYSLLQTEADLVGIEETWRRSGRSSRSCRASVLPQPAIWQHSFVNCCGLNVKIA